LPCAGWETVITAVGFTDLEFGPSVDTYGGALGEKNARLFGTWGYPFRAHKPL
jgi:hypothetical protein